MCETILDRTVLIRDMKEYLFCALHFWMAVLITTIARIRANGAVTFVR